MLLRKKFFKLLVAFILLEGYCMASCPAGWTDRSGQCYFASSAKYSWTIARSNCMTMGADLVSIADAGERDYIYNSFIKNTGNKFWIGLNDVNYEGNFVWSDGTAFNNTVAAWKLGQPDNGRDTGDATVQEDCVAINDETDNAQSQGSWDDNQCDKSRSYICKKSDEDVPDCDVSAGFEKHGSYCYRLVEEEYDWATAEKMCEDGWNAELTAVTSDVEQTQIITMMMRVNKDIWIGLSDTITQGVFRWSNGHDQLVYTNWATGEPLPATGSESRCVQSSVASVGMWNTADCSSPKPFICRKGLRAVCPDGWIYGHGKCYELIINSNFFLSWSEANKYCTAKNARMLKIQSDDEQHFVSAFGTELYKEGILQLWLGISDIGHDQSLTWSDQSAVTYSQWDGLHNPREGQDDCAQFYAGKAYSNWELVTCFSQQAFMCEITEGTPLSDIDIPTELYYECPDNWRLHGSYCYLFGEEKMTWAPAEQLCVASGGHLASIHNEDQQSFVAAHLLGQSWIGATDELSEGNFQWTDGTPFNFTNWNDKEPNGGPSENCAHCWSNTLGTWNDDPCSRGDKSYVCQRNAVALNTPKPIPTLPPDANVALCGAEGYVHNPSTHKCYKVVDQFSRNWQDARIHCLQEGGDLASINSPDEQAFLEVNTVLSATQIALWVGAEDSKGGPINAPVVDLTDGGWRWSDGSPFNFVNWNPGEPNNVNEEDCVEMQVSGGKWNDLKCTDFRGYICEKEDPDHTTPAPAADCNGVDCCYRHIGVERGGSVKNRQLSASSQLDKASGADRGRLGTYDQYIELIDVGPGKGGWMPLKDQAETQWIQVDLEQFYEVRGVITQGLNGLSQPLNQNAWTKTISVKYKTHKVEDVWEQVRDSLGNKMIFDANYDQNTQVTSLFPRPVVAAGIRIYTESCRLACAMRFEVIGCLPQCDDSLVVDPNSDYPVIPDSSYLASSSMSNFGPQKSKLDYSESTGGSNCWKPSTSDKNQWIQIDLSEPRKISGILMQGNPQAAEFVTEYYVQFSDDGASFTTYLNTDGNNQLFPANRNQRTISEGFLREPITTRFVRVLPQTWSAAIALRFDVIGCFNDDLVTCSDTAESRPDSFTVDCPTGCDLTTAAVYGTEVYAQQSSICAAAIHDGRILGDHGGTVDVNKITGKSSYSGSYAHGITSQDYGSSEKSFTFQGDHLGCDNGWYGWQDWCYYTPRHSPQLNWADSRTYCQQKGGDLASIHSKAEQDFVTTLMFYQYTVRDTWIGMTDLAYSNYYQWSDGTDVTFTAWKPLEPNNDHENCVELYRTGGLWNDVSCDVSNNNLVCKMDKYPVNDKETVVDGCETGWVAYEGSCYFFDLTRMVWINAENYCKGVGGHLTAVNSIYEQMFLLSQIAEATPTADDEKFWIGLGAFIVPDSDALTYSWSTGEPVTFTAWDKNQPDIKHTCSFPFLYNGIEYYNCIEEGLPYDIVGPWCSADPVFTNHFVACNGWSDSQVGCFRMDSITGLWSQGQPVACGSDAYKICEKPRVGYTNPALPTTPSPNGRCPSGWYSSSQSNYCYQINEMPATLRLNWADADVNCRSQGAQLASMHSYQEEDVIASGVKHTSGNDFFWIGLKKVDGSSYSWTDGTPFVYSNWKSDEPNNHNGAENCVEANFPDGSAGWNDMTCISAQNWICKILRGTPLLPPVTVQPQLPDYQCGSDKQWYSFTPGQSKYCYTFVTELLGLYDAGKKCKELGGNLVSITSQEEQTFLTGITTKIDLADFWIGLVQDGYNGYYLWLDGSTLGYANWGFGEPNNYNGQESCVSMSNLYSTWNDDNCGKTHGYICKKLIGSLPVTPTPTPPVPGGCDDGWTLYGSKCFLFVGWTDGAERKSWRDAESYCNQKNGFLASVPNQFYNAYLMSQMYQLNSAVWIGLNTIGNNRQFLWSDNEAVTYTNWDSNEPNDQGTEECVEMYTSGRWNDQTCEDVRPFICNDFRSTDFAEPQPDTSQCPSGYIKWDTGCYKLFSDASEQLTWENARDKCRSDGSKFNMNIELVSVWNSFENSFLKAMFWPEVEYDYAWIGLYYNHSQTNGETTFLWVDGSAVYYTNWESNQPQDTSTSTGCIVMRDYGTWSLVDANECNVKRPFVCKYEKLTFPTETPGLGMCDPDWLAFGDYCYYIKPGIDNPSISWGDAESACNTRGGNLVSLHSDLENKAVNNWAVGNNVWLGLKRNAWGGWVWSDASPVDFTNWKDGEPNNYGETGEQCTEMNHDGVWNDGTCTDTRGYICKKHKSYSSCVFSSTERTDCGYDGISEYECLERLCCWDPTGSAASVCYHSKDDAQCLEKGGQCRDYRYNTCELGYETNLCGGGTHNQCCFSCDELDETCNSQVEGWEQNDGPCEDDGNVAGNCQYNTNYCDGTYLPGLCGGPGERQCCSSKGPTDPPKTTKTIPKTDSTVKTNTPGTTQTPKKTTTKIVATDKVPTGKSGLSGGAIAGIVITVIFLVVGGGLAFYFYRTGELPSPTSLSNSLPFGKKAPAPAGGFDNPISYVKDSEDDGNLNFGASDA